MTAVQPVNQAPAAANGQTNPAYAYNAQCMQHAASYAARQDSTRHDCRVAQWRSQDLEVGAQRVWGTEVPQRGPGAEPLVLSLIHI